MAYWLVTVPNEGGSPDQTFRQLQAQTASPRHDLAQLCRLEMPSLLVGTLDSLMSMSDELSRVDMTVESVVRKIERQYAELGGARDDLMVGTVPAEAYLRQFVWDYAKYPNKRPLPELAALIQGGVGKVDDELRQLALAYTEKNALFQASRRKKGGSLMVANLDDVLTPEVMEGHVDSFLDTDNLKTLVAIVPKNLQQEWEDNYTTIGQGIAGYGGPDWCDTAVRENLGTDDGSYGVELDRYAVTGSPVVPGSSRLLVEQEDACLYAVTIIRGAYSAGDFEGDEFQVGQQVNYISDVIQAARERRFVLREFTYDPQRSQTTEQEAEQLAQDVEHLQSSTLRWCLTHFAEAFVAWTHIKIIRSFVESVLRYGLPVDFLAVLFKPHKNQEGRLKDTLEGMYVHLRGAGFGDDDKADESEGDYLPFVCNQFKPQIGI